MQNYLKIHIETKNMKKTCICKKSIEFLLKGKYWRNENGNYEARIKTNHEIKTYIELSSSGIKSSKATHKTTMKSKLWRLKLTFVH